MCSGLNIPYVFCSMGLQGAAKALVLILSRLIRAIVLPGASRSAALTYKLFNVPVSFVPARSQVSIIVTRDVLPFIAHATTHHRLAIILMKPPLAHTPNPNQKYVLG